MADFAAKLQAHLASQETRTATLRRIGDKAMAITSRLPAPVFVLLPPEPINYVMCQWHTSNVLYKSRTVSLFFSEGCVTVGTDNQQRYTYDQADVIVARVRGLLDACK
jgi:hypothetical protein